MPMLQRPSIQGNARTLAASWRERMNPASAFPALVSIQSNARDRVIEALAQFVATTVHARQTLLLVIPDDDWLPELSDALDLAVLQLCLLRVDDQAIAIQELLGA